MAALVKVRPCSVMVRRQEKVEPCGAPLHGEKCSQRDLHMLPFETGFCNSGWHEGYKVDKPTCQYYAICPCRCHQDLWIMFELAERERTLQDNSTYRPPSLFVMPTQDERIRERIISNHGNTDAPTVLKSPLRASCRWR